MGVAFAGFAGQKLKTGQVFGLAVFEADVFKKQDGRWLYVSLATSIPDAGAIGPPNIAPAAPNDAGPTSSGASA